MSKRDATAADLGLVPFGDGYRYDGSKAERFDALIERDGKVRFELDGKVQAKLDGVCLVGACKLTRRDASTWARASVERSAQRKPR